MKHLLIAVYFVVTSTSAVAGVCSLGVYPYNGKNIPTFDLFLDKTQVQQDPLYWCDGKQCLWQIETAYSRMIATWTKLADEGVCENKPPRNYCKLVLVEPFVYGVTFNRTLIYSNEKIDSTSSVKKDLVEKGICQDGRNSSEQESESEPEPVENKSPTDQERFD